MPFIFPYLQLWPLPPLLSNAFICSLCLSLRLSLPCSCRSVVIVSYISCCMFREKCTARLKKMTCQVPFLVSLLNNCQGEKNCVNTSLKEITVVFGQAPVLNIFFFLISSGETSTVKQSRTQRKRNILTQVQHTHTHIQHTCFEVILGFLFNL